MNMAHFHADSLVGATGMRYYSWCICRLLSPAREHININQSVAHHSDKKTYFLSLCCSRFTLAAVVSLNRRIKLVMGLIRSKFFVFHFLRSRSPKWRCSDGTVPQDGWWVYAEIMKEARVFSFLWHSLSEGGVFLQAESRIHNTFITEILKKAASYYTLQISVDKMTEM